MTSKMISGEQERSKNGLTLCKKIIFRVALFLKDLKVPIALSRSKAVRFCCNLLNRKVDKWEENCFVIDGRTVLILPLCGSSSFIEHLKESSISYQKVHPKNTSKIDIVLRRSEAKRVRSGFVKKILNPDRLGKLVLFSQLKIDPDISIEEFTSVVCEWNKSREIQAIDKHFVFYSTLLLRFPEQLSNTIELDLDFDGLNKLLAMLNMESTKKRKLSSSDMKMHLSNDAEAVISRIIATSTMT